MTSREPRWTLSPRARAAAAGLALLLGVALPNPPAWAQARAPVLYQWTDENGNVRYTPDPERVPSSRRDSMQRLEPGVPPSAPPPAGACAQPGGVRGHPAGSARRVQSPARLRLRRRHRIRLQHLRIPFRFRLPLLRRWLRLRRSRFRRRRRWRRPGPSAASTLRAGSRRACCHRRASRPGGRPGERRRPAARRPGFRGRRRIRRAEDAAREQQLAAAIAADQEALKALISAPVAPGEAPLTDSPQLREIARRLPEMQAELAALRERRAPPAGP